MTACKDGGLVIATGIRDRVAVQQVKHPPLLPDMEVEIPWRDTGKRQPRCHCGVGGSHASNHGMVDDEILDHTKIGFKSLPPFAKTQPNEAPRLSEVLGYYPPGTPPPACKNSINPMGPSITRIHT